MAVAQSLLFAFALTAIAGAPVHANDLTSLQAVIDSRVCPSNPMSYANVTYKEYCGADFDTAMSAMRAHQCMQEADRINDTIRNYNAFMLDCREFARRQGQSRPSNTQSTSGGTVPAQTSAPMVRPDGSAAQTLPSSDATFCDRFKYADEQIRCAVDCKKEEAVCEQWRKLAPAALIPTTSSPPLSSAPPSTIQQQTPPSAAKNPLSKKQLARACDAANGKCRATCAREWKGYPNTTPVILAGLGCEATCEDAEEKCREGRMDPERAADASIGVFLKELKGSSRTNGSARRSRSPTSNEGGTSRRPSAAASDGVVYCPGATGPDSGPAGCVCRPGTTPSQGGTTCFR